MNYSGRKNQDDQEEITVRSGWKYLSGQSSQPSEVMRSVTEETVERVKAIFAQKLVKNSK